MSNNSTRTLGHQTDNWHRKKCCQDIFKSQQGPLPTRGDLEVCRVRIVVVVRTPIVPMVKFQYEDGWSMSRALGTQAANLGCIAESCRIRMDLVGLGDTCHWAIAWERFLSIRDMFGSCGTRPRSELCEVLQKSWVAPMLQSWDSYWITDSHSEPGEPHAQICPVRCMSSRFRAVTVRFFFKWHRYGIRPCQLQSGFQKLDRKLWMLLILMEPLTWTWMSGVTPWWGWQWCGRESGMFVDLKNSSTWCHSVWLWCLICQPNWEIIN